MNILCIVLAGIISGILYRIGGSGKFNTKIRDLGVPTIMIGYFILMGHFHWSLLICFLLMFGSLTTYFKKKGTDAEWWNWLLVGLAYSISMLPFVIANGNYIGFLERAAVVTIFTTLWSEFNGNAVQEELGRGFIITSTLCLL